MIEIKPVAWRCASPPFTDYATIDPKRAELCRSSKDFTVTPLYALDDKHVIVPTWQPFDTAPRDGSCFLVLLEKEFISGKIQAAQYSKSSNGHMLCIGRYFSLDCPKPLAWMPMDSMLSAAKEFLE